jgi:hypothetical protein
VIDGQAADRAISVTQSNIAAFNTYANTSNGLARHYELGEDITLTGVNNWIAIGSDLNRFTGSFDGKTRTISGLSINNSTSNNQGMFAAIGTSGSVKNLGINGSITGSTYVGGIAGSNAGVIEYCYVTADINGNDGVGGLVGDNVGTVRNCYSRGDVNADGNSAGGIAGINAGTVQYCYASGDISGKFYVGGIVGSNASGTVRNCVALNEDIAQTNSFGRVVGANGTQSGNYARVNMALNGSPITWPSKGPATANGTDIGERECSNQTSWRNTAGFSGSWWTAARLPTSTPFTMNVLSMEIKAPPAKTLTVIPIERTDTFTVEVSGFILPAHANTVQLVIPAITGLSFSGHTATGNATADGIKTFTVTVTYNGTTPIGGADIFIDNLTGYSTAEYSYDNGYIETYIDINDGQDSGRPIQLDKDNIVSAASIMSGNTRRYYELTENVTLTSWPAISKFIGHFEGNDHTISNLTITNTSTGMFTEIGAGGEVKNLTLVNCTINANGYVGGIAGINSGTIRNCAVQGNVSGTYSGIGLGGTGGLAGENRGTVENCYFVGNVTGKSCVGGVVGFNDGGKVVNCYAAGNTVTGTNNYVGGVVGGNEDGTVQNCVALNRNISASTDFGRVVGINSVVAVNLSETLIGNYGRDTMLKENASTTWGNIGLTSRDGATITSTSWENPTWWTTTAGFTDSWWTAARLPPTVTVP